MPRWMIGLVALLVAVPAVAQDLPREAIEAAMTDSAAGWDKGDIDRFLQVYSNDPATSFTTSEGIARSKADVRARYLKRYAAQWAADRSGASKLSFVFEDFRPLGADHALLTARWKLVQRGKEQSGMTTLVFRREAGDWKIVADHSS